MMKYPLIFFLLLASLPLFAQIPERDADDTCWTAVKKPKDVCRRVVLYRPGDHSSKNYRIPAIVTAGDGSLVTARWCSTTSVWSGCWRQWESDYLSWLSSFSTTTGTTEDNIKSLFSSRSFTKRMRTNSFIKKHI